MIVSKFSKNVYQNSPKDSKYVLIFFLWLQSFLQFCYFLLNDSHKTSSNHAAMLVLIYPN
jgi:hypothetical protein